MKEDAIEVLNTNSDEGEKAVEWFDKVSFYHLQLIREATLLSADDRVE